MDSILNDNIDLAMRVSDLVREFNPQILVFLSSVSVYGKITSEILHLESPYNHPDKYGCSKLISEELLKSVCVANNTQAICLRIPGTVGKESYGNIISRIGAHLLNADQKRLRLCNQNKLFNNILTIDPLYDFISEVVILNRIEARTKTLILASQDPINFGEVVELMCNKLNVSFSKYIEWFESESNSFFIDISEAVSHNYFPLSTQESISDFCDELLANDM